MEHVLSDDDLMKDDVDDALMEQDFKDGGAKYPTIEASCISSLMRNIVYSTHRVPNTTTVVATATLNLNEHTFTLASASTACADPRNFNEEKGTYYALQKATKAAREKLWEFEGYLLFKRLAEEQKGE